MVILRFGEIFLKRGKTKSFFIFKLINNIKFIIYEFKPEIFVVKSLIIIQYFNRENAFQVLLLLKKIIFGIANGSVCIKSSKEKIMDTLYNEYINYDFNTFAINFRNHLNINIKRLDFNKEIGLLFNQKFVTKKVKLVQPDLEIRIELIKTDFYCICIKNEIFNGGLPTGSSGKILSLISGGIDSSVSSYLIMKKGFNADYIHFTSSKFSTDNSIKRVKKQIKNLNKYNKKKCILYLVNMDLFINELNCISDKSLRLIILRRFFYLIADRISVQKKYLGIITGESINQVSSQTIRNLKNCNKIINDSIIITSIINIW